ncbi:MAG TPA: phytanoyl-CoA dioxygenase, partial [Cystobacter sp.]
SSPSRTGSRRRGFSACYMSADTRCVRKKKAPRDFFPLFRRASR